MPEFFSAPAKINLFFNIVSKRSNCYHNIESLFVPLKLVDHIKIEPNQRVTLSLPGSPSITNNTAQKLLDILEPLRPKSCGAKITIIKNIPIGGGLGGSSTDAGTLLTILNKFWDLNLPPNELIQIATLIGADVPFFLDPKPSLVRGIGDDIQPIPFMDKEIHLVLFSPQFEMSTKLVYTNCNKPFTKPLPSLNHDVINDNITFGGNDLEHAAIKLEPLIGELLEEIKSSEGCILSRMTGSGSTCFGLYRNKSLALKAQKYYAFKYKTYYEYIRI